MVQGSIRELQTDSAANNLPFSEQHDARLPEARQLRYKELLKAALLGVKHYDGTRSRFDALCEGLIHLENMAKETFNGGLTDFLEEELSKNVGRRSSEGISISGLLLRAQSRFERRLQTSHQETFAVVETKVASALELGYVLLPPGDSPGPKRGDGEGLGEPIFHPRLAELLAFLVSKDITLDEIDITRGQVSEDMMRKASYCLVEISQLNAQILVCDQVGEATFVIKPTLPLADYTRLSKEELGNKTGVTRVVYNNKNQWLGQIEQVIESEVSHNSIPGGWTRNTPTEYEIARNIWAEIGGPEEWARMTTTRWSNLKLGDVGNVALSKLFNVAHADTKECIIRVGQAIYGNHPIFEKWLGKIEEKKKLLNSLDGGLSVLKSLLEKEIGGPEKWAGMSTTEWAKRKFSGFGSKLLCQKLGISYVASRECILRVGVAIYGNHSVFENGLRQIEETKELLNSFYHDPNAFKPFIRNKIGSPEDWAKLTTRKWINIAERIGLGAEILCNVYGVPYGYTRECILTMGVVIYGNHPVFEKGLRQIEETKKLLNSVDQDPDAFKSFIKNKIGGPEEWAKMSVANWIKVTFAGVGYKTLCTKFNIPIAGSRECMLKLGIAIYGNSPVLENELRQIEGRRPGPLRL